MAINERAHVDLSGLDIGDEPAILGATDGSFFRGPAGETFVSAISLVGTITFRFFMAAMRRPDLALDPRFATPGARRANLEALKAIVQAWIYSFPDLAALDAQLDEAKIAIGEIRSLQEVADSEWANYWTATHRVPDRNGGEFRLPGRPWRFSAAELDPPGEPALQGEHNAANALAALAMGEVLGLPRAPVLAALAAFGGLPHRAQWVADVGGVHFIDDSKGTNVGATIAAVAGMDGPLVLIAGGDGKGQDFDDLRAAFRGKVRHAVLIGRDAPRLAAVLEDVCATESASDMPGAVTAARAAARPGDTVLLSPACASLDMFRDYRHRGEEFAAAVRSLAG